MNDLFSTYNLYCINMHCSASIYRRIDDVKRPFNAENILATHYCFNCSRPLVSKMDMEIEQLTAKAGIRVADKTNFNTSH